MNNLITWKLKLTVFFFLTSNGHFITQTWGGLGNQTGIEQPMKSNSLWKVLAVLAKKSDIWLRARGTWVILNSGKQIWSVYIFSNSVAKLGHSWDSFIIAISSLQSVPKLWHGECWSIFSIAHRRASTSECNADSHRVKFRVPISCMFSPLSIQTHPHPLKRSEVVQDPSSMQILPKLKT